MNDRTAHCTLIVKVLAADGVIAPIEREFMDKAMRRLGLPPAEREQVLRLEGWEEAEQKIADLPPGRRRAVLDELIEAARVDGVLAPEEAAVVARLTEAFALP